MKIKSRNEHQLKVHLDSKYALENQGAGQWYGETYAVHMRDEK
jgi:hypothetical protein